VTWRAARGHPEEPMKRLPALLLPACLVLLPTGLFAQIFDEITVKDGSRIIGEIVDMTDGVVNIKTAFAGDLKIKWEEVTDLKTVKALPFVLKDGTRILGVADGMREGRIAVKSEALAEPTPVPVDSLSSINPPQKPITYQGFVSLGGSVSGGNTHNKTFSFASEFQARADRQRLTIRAAYNYAEDEDDLTVRNGTAFMKYDFFLTKRLYWFASALFEHDTFQDLDLRVALGTGPGFQIIDKGDFSQAWLSELQVFFEAGVAYFNDDYDDAEDDSYISGRWSLSVNWPIVPKKVTLFHFHEGYPSLEDLDDIYITTQQGARFAIWNNFIATFQVNWKWDTTPAPGFGREDTLYLVTIGYSFDTW
jgi:putative salt-induced outer membrane protein YdiY